MSYEVHLSVSFPCERNDAVAELASRHLAALAPVGENRDTDDARVFLGALSDRSGENPGWKGGVSTWGMIGNYSNAARFAEVLRDFWLDLLGGVKGGPMPFEHVVVFDCAENSTANAVEISLDRPFSRDAATLRMVEHDLPFSWG